MTTVLELAEYEIDSSDLLLEASHKSISTLGIGEEVSELIAPFIEELNALESNGKDKYTLDALSNEKNKINKTLNECISENINSYASKDREDKDYSETILYELISLKKLISERSLGSQSDFTRIIIGII